MSSARVSSWQPAAAVRDVIANSAARLSFSTVHVSPFALALFFIFLTY